jgi:hypothetical protein
MANYTPRTEIDAIIPEKWTPFLQVPLYKSLVAVAQGGVARTKLEPFLRDGQVINHSYIDMPDVVDYTPLTQAGGGINTYHAIDATGETLTVNQAKVAPFYVERLENLQIKEGINPMAELGKRAGYKLKDSIDTAVLAETLNGTQWNVSDVLSKSNIIDFAAEGRKKLREASVEEDGTWIMVVDPLAAQYIELAATSAGFSVADATLKNGYAGNFMGFRIFVSNNLPDSGTGTGKAYYIGKPGSIDLVMQVEPKMDISKAEDAIEGYKFKPYTLYGTKVFTEGVGRFLCANTNIAS